MFVLNFLGYFNKKRVLICCLSMTLCIKKRLLIDLALKAGRKRQSPQTGFLHIGDTIPVYENACFALALFRSRLTDDVLEGKRILERLLGFEVNGHFPIHLHEYPECRDWSLSSRMRPIFHAVLRDFGPVLGELMPKIEATLARIVSRPSKEEPQTATEWGEALIAAQMSTDQEIVQRAVSHWHPELFAYTGPCVHAQDGHLPALTLYDLFMIQMAETVPARFLEEHPLHLQAALVYPLGEVALAETKPYALHLSDTVFKLMWGDRERPFSLFCQQKQGKMNAIEVDDGVELTFVLPEKLPEEGREQMEIRFFLSYLPEISLFVNQKKATTFQLSDEVEIKSPSLQLKMTFVQSNSDDQFFGHLSMANRPTQLRTSVFESYDWQIGLRTIRRSPQSSIKVKLAF